MEITVAGRTLQEFWAKVNGYPEIESCSVDTGIYQGADRSSMQLLYNRRGMRSMTLRMDFYGKNSYDRTRNRSAFEALFLSREPVVVDICDGYWYKAVLTKIKTVGTESNLISTVEYTLAATRHREQETAVTVMPNDAKIFCQSNVAKTDCAIYLPSKFGATDLWVQLNGYTWNVSSAPDGEIILDGCNKIFTVNGVNANSLITWTDFPFLVPGENVFNVYADGTVPTGLTASLTYTPTFL